MGYFTFGENTLTFRQSGETLTIAPWGRNSFRVRSVLQGAFPDTRGALLEPVEPLTVTAEIGQREASIRNGKITAQLAVNEWGKALQISFFNERGELLLQEISNGGALQKRARDFLPLPGGHFALKVSFLSNPKEKLFGMGQYQQDIFDLKGCNLELAPRNSQASVPFYLSSLGYGFLWNNPAIGEVHFGLNTTEWTARETAAMDYWITAGDSPAEIEAAYSSVVGRAPMMPEYGLGFWQCKLRYFNQEQVLNIAREYKRRGIPLDVLVIDYYHWLRCGDWRFDPEYFPDPAAMVAELKSMGVETMVSVWPAVDWRSENFEELRQRGLLVRNNTGLPLQMDFHGNNAYIDPTNPETRRYVWEKCRENYGSLGIRTFWLDVAEPEYNTANFENYRYYAGTALETGNLYPKEYARMFYEGMQAAGQKDIVNLIRCAWAGSQRYGILVWSGDIMSTWEDFRKQLTAGLHMGIAGIPWWTTDIGGFHNGETASPAFRELLVRWFQFGTFCPVMRIHGTRTPVTPIVNKAGEVREQTGADNEIWSFGEENYPILKHYIEVREHLRSYTRSLMAEAHENGSPVLRTLFYEFPNDPACWSISDEYLYGGDLLVAPILSAGAVSRRVYLPAGAQWVHASTGKAYEGGQEITVPAPIASIPVFLRNGKQEYLLGQV